MNKNFNDNNTTKDDGKYVGKFSIFDSCPNVIAPPTSSHNKNRIPTPSIYRDGRGSIHNLLIDETNSRYNVLYSKAGVMRSGDLHQNIQCDFVFEGRVCLWTLQSDGTTHKQIYTEHDYIEIPKATPHIFEFVEDTILAEWWEEEEEKESNEKNSKRQNAGVDGFQAWFYKPYRDLVEQSFQSEERGKMVVLVPCSTTNDTKDDVMDWKSITVAGMIGVIVGGIVATTCCCLIMTTSSSNRK